jgi:PD-(D/E)XK nuclease superfamily protein
VGLIDHATNQLSDGTIEAAIEVHRDLGPGLLVSSYHACLCHELERRGISYESPAWFPGSCAYCTTMGAVHRNDPHSITSLPCRASLGSTVMVNFSTGVATLSDFIAAVPRS